ncbi:segregation and condensation protein B [Lysinibacillus halotolerans]
MFEVNGVNYTLKFNKQKLKTIETAKNISVVSEIKKSEGILPYQLLETLFSLTLVEEATNEVVKQSKAQEMFEKVVEENGLITTSMAIVEKLQEDMGFLFR